MNDPSTCIFKRLMKWKIVGTSGKASKAMATTHKRCEQCQDNIDTCLRTSFKEQTGKGEMDYSQMNIYINLKPRSEIGEATCQETENEQEQETPDF